MKNLYTVSYLALILVTANNINAAGAGSGDFTPPYTGAASATTPASTGTHVPPYATAAAAITHLPPYTTATTAAAGTEARRIIGLTPDFMPIYEDEPGDNIDRVATIYTYLQDQLNAYRESLANPAGHAASGELPFYAQLQAQIGTAAADDAPVAAAAGAGAGAPFSSASYAAMIAAIGVDISSDPTALDATPMPAIATAAAAAGAGVTIPTVASASTAAAGAGTTSATAYDAMLQGLRASSETPSSVGASVTASAVSAPMEDVRIEAPAASVDLTDRRNFLSLLMLNDALIRGAYLTADARGIDDRVLCGLTLRDSDTALNVLHQLQFIAGAKGFKIINPDDTWYGDLAGYFTNMMIRAYYNPNHVTFLKEAIRVARIEPILAPADIIMVKRLEDALKSWEREHPEAI